MPFTTGAVASNLLQVEAIITTVAGGANGNGNLLTLSLFSDSSNLPGSLIGNLTFAPPPNLGVFGFSAPAGVFLPSSTLSLAPSTTYWIVAEGFGNAYYVWNISSAGPTGAITSSGGAFTSSSFSLATRVTIDTINTQVPELNPTAAHLPLLFVSLMLAMGLARRDPRPFSPSSR